MGVIGPGAVIGPVPVAEAVIGPVPVAVIVPVACQPGRTTVRWAEKSPQVPSGSLALSFTE